MAGTRARGGSSRRRCSQTRNGTILPSIAVTGSTPVPMSARVPAHHASGASDAGHTIAAAPSTAAPSMLAQATGHSSHSGSWRRRARSVPASPKAATTATNASHASSTAWPRAGCPGHSRVAPLNSASGTQCAIGRPRASAAGRRGVCQNIGSTVVATPVTSAASQPPSAHAICRPSQRATGTCHQPPRAPASTMPHSTATISGAPMPARVRVVASTAATRRPAASRIAPASNRITATAAAACIATGSPPSKPMPRAVATPAPDAAMNGASSPAPGTATPATTGIIWNSAPTMTGSSMPSASTCTATSASGAKRSGKPSGGPAASKTPAAAPSHGAGIRQPNTTARRGARS
ncbi:hypothetical protein D9M72_413350 [compost metagenome]